MRPLMCYARVCTSSSGAVARLPFPFSISLSQTGSPTQVPSSMRTQPAFLSFHPPTFESINSFIHSTDQSFNHSFALASSPPPCPNRAIRACRLHVRACVNQGCECTGPNPSIQSIRVAHMHGRLTRTVLTHLASSSSSAGSANRLARASRFSSCRQSMQTETPEASENETRNYTHKYKDHTARTSALGSAIPKRAARARRRASSSSSMGSAPMLGPFFSLRGSFRCCSC